MSKKIQIVILITLILLLIAINYSWIDGLLIKNFENINREDFIVKRIIDGDTIVVGEDLKVRLFGINCPEKGEKYYEEAGKFLEKEILGKTVFIESFGKDLYYRELGVVFLGKENINVELVERGLANVYILDNKNYEKELRDAWEKCIINEKNLCEKSKDKCINCIELKKFENQEVIFYNKCNFDCDLKNWTIKDEGRKKFAFQDFILDSGKEIKVTAEDFGEEYVWTLTGDTLFLRDSENKLILWENY